MTVRNRAQKHQRSSKYPSRNTKPTPAAPITKNRFKFKYGTLLQPQSLPELWKMRWPAKLVQLIKPNCFSSSCMISRQVKYASSACPKTFLSLDLSNTVGKIFWYKMVEPLKLARLVYKIVASATSIPSRFCAGRCLVVAMNLCSRECMTSLKFKIIRRT